ncbi:calcium/sodium antiporter [Desulfurivibrio alkaliphilus]|uniref:Na+/Ca+ antiporter, CaCA family n=1 Tax=Desulfurivibrio alkaliphilus (strain DSM 19089 / UNIQEM U267 / AHT2) TaxID=589865 RepID=D6Z700_DESAT|nr:calcium/sodium antiporter [Desulfurivibrio alkaliphilus]ADH86987.1 Na+/Ca+ antiporter, CaCA family [Desulfurivibrio alkaliphilus AHT 2]
MTETTLLWPLLILLSGLLLLWGGGELLVGGARRLARLWGMSPLLIGLTVVAFGTSLPELFVSLAASWRGHPEIMLGNVVGSNIANIGLILALVLLLVPLRLAFRTVVLELGLLHLATALLLALAFYGFFPRPVGLLFVGALIFYTSWAYRGSNRAGKEAALQQDPEIQTKPGGGGAVALALLLVLGGLAALAGGAELFIQGAVAVASYFGVAELVIGLTLAAIGTSLPELATCLVAVRHRQDALVVGNIIGSNLFNLLMVLGVTASLMPFALPPVLLARDLPVMLAFSLLLLVMLYLRERLSRGLGVVLLATYLLYIVSLV